MSTPTSVVVVNNPTDQIIITTTDVVDYDAWFNVAYPLQVRWKSEDTSLFITATGEPTSVKQSKGSRSGLNISSIVIITIVCVLVVISAVLSTIWWAWRKKLKKQATLGIARTGTTQVDGIQLEIPTELHGQGVLIPFL